MKFYPMKPTRNHEELALFFTAIGHKRRLMICDILLNHGRRGLSFELLQAKTRMAASTLGHHLGQMDKGGVLRRRTKGRETWFSMDFARLNTIPAGFSDSCQNSILHP
ncbi:MAG: winged helix-turn-helix domain-containing protein [Paracoccaceae bacterium]